MGKAINDPYTSAPWWQGPRTPTAIVVHVIIIYIVTVLLASTPTVITILIKYLFT